MTTIIFRKSVSGEYKEIECLGHADFDAYGKDIVCAALSVLVINTLNSLDALCKTDMDVRQNEEKGQIKCTFRKPLQSGEQLLLDSLALGCNAIEQQYGKKYCKIRFEEV